MGTEFGRALEVLVEVPGGAGAVLCDDRGYAIDYVRRSPRLTDVDVQLLGAQLGHTLERLDDGLGRRGLAAPIVMLESSARALLAASIARTYVVTLLLLRPANFALAIRRFEGVRADLSRLLA